MLEVTKHATNVSSDIFKSLSAVTKRDSSGEGGIGVTCSEKFKRACRMIRGWMGGWKDLLP